MDTFPVTDRTRLRRLPEQGSHERQTIYAILDEALICHVGFIDAAQPVVIPTLHVRDGDRLYLHGSPASRMLRTLKGGADVCVTVTLVDGIVLARAPFHSSFNYRSAIVFGNGREVSNRQDKLRAFRLLTERVTPGRWEDCRRPTEAEIRGTTVLAIDLESASAKARAGPPADDEADYRLPIWSGVIPIETAWGAPVPDPLLLTDVPLPAYLER